MAVDEDGVVIDQDKDGALTVVEPSALEALNRAEIDMLIATAKKYPRSLTQVRRDALDLVTQDATVAAECTYSLPRGGKKIVGPSVRFAEMLTYAWGNCRSGARVVAVGDKMITAQGYFADLQRNVAVTFEVQRRITDSQGRRYNDDMITVTGNAACSIAMRNAVFHGIPKALWRPFWERSIAAAKGDIATLEARRAEALRVMQTEFKCDIPRVCAALEIDGPNDIGLDKLLELSQMIATVRSGESTLEDAFPPVNIVRDKQEAKAAAAKTAKDLAREQAQQGDTGADRQKGS